MATNINCNNYCEDWYALKREVNRLRSVVREYEAHIIELETEIKKLTGEYKEEQND